MIDKREIELFEARELLKSQNLDEPKHVDYSIGLFEYGKLIGTGSITGGVIKGLAIDDSYQGLGLLNKIVSDLISNASYSGINEIFIFTQSQNITGLESLGFNSVVSVDGMCLMEKSLDGIEAYKESLEAMKKENSSAIVMNGNPFTLGHKHLIEKASRESSHVFLFVVEEDLSVFPFYVRLKLIQEGINHLDNVSVIPSGRYIISSLVFPTYFTKEKSEMFRGRLDVTLFAEHIASTLGIKRRYVGREPFCETTRQYNEVMKEILPLYDIEVIAVDRLKCEDEYISATSVRKFLREKDFVALEKLVPRSTLDFLKSKAFEPIYEKLLKVNPLDYVNNK